MKDVNPKYCIIDAGNTQVKVADFQHDELVQLAVIPNEEQQKIQETLLERKESISIFSSVRSKAENKIFINYLNPDVVLTNETPLPISIEDYRTPRTLGVDRIANVVAARHYSNTDNALVVDIGTCITIDLILKDRYQGGSISPGYLMRLKAMNHFTGELPLLELESFDSYIGKSTKESMLAGINLGIQSEISQFIHFYTQNFAPLTIFLTGGDLKRFEIPLKNSIFADNNFTIKGLYLILKHNV